MGSLRSGWSRCGIYRSADGREIKSRQESKSRQAKEQEQSGRKKRKIEREKAGAEGPLRSFRRRRFWDGTEGEIVTVLFCPVQGMCKKDKKEGRQRKEDIQ